MMGKRILHVANFEQFKYGQWYMGLDSKLSYGLIQLGHCVESFSHRDIARSEHFLKSKKGGQKKMNRRFVEILHNYQPEIVLLGHSELIDEESIQYLKRLLPDCKVAMWYCDPLFHDHGVKLLQSRLPYLDALFTTTGGSWLASLGRNVDHNCRLAHIPNWVHAAVESGKAFEEEDYAQDMVFAGSDYREQQRQSLLISIRDEIPGLRFKIYQALDNPRIHGYAYYKALASSLMGLSLSRRTDVDWYSSDRLQQMMGNGLCTFSPRTPGLEKIFSNEELVWFDSTEDLVEKVHFYLKNPDDARIVAKNGWEKVHKVCSADFIAQYMLETIFKMPYSSGYVWQEQQY